MLNKERIENADIIVSKFEKWLDYEWRELNSMKGEKMIKAEEMFMELGFEKSTLINKNNVARYKIPNSQNFVAFYKNDDGTTKIDYKIGARYNKKKRFMECVNKQMEEIQDD